MNQAHWLTERLYEDKATQLQKEAENQRRAQELMPEAAESNFLTKLWNERSAKAQASSPKQR